jgi:hypothetical protein
MKVENDSLIGDLGRPPQCSANGPSVVRVLPFCRRTVVAPRRAAACEAINETAMSRGSSASAVVT